MKDLAMDLAWNMFKQSYKKSFLIKGRRVMKKHYGGLC